MIEPADWKTNFTVWPGASASWKSAWMGRSKRFVEWGWLLYPVLAATGLKILLEDFPRSRPATLFLALAVYGCALIFSPRLRRSPAAWVK